MRPGGVGLQKVGVGGGVSWASGIGMKETLDCADRLLL